jgi:hypothetical protein
VSRQFWGSECFGPEVIVRFNKLISCGIIFFGNWKLAHEFDLTKSCPKLPSKVFCCCRGETQMFLFESVLAGIITTHKTGHTNFVRPFIEIMVPDRTF